METASSWVKFPKSETRVSFSSSKFLHLTLICTLFITKSTSIPQDFSEIPYPHYCNGVVREAPLTETRLPTDNLLRLDKAVYSLGSQNPQFNFNPNSPQVATFSIRKAYETKSKGIVKVNAILNLAGPNIIDYFSGNIPRRRLRLVRVRPPRFETRKDGAGFWLFGFWDSGSGKVCMVGSGSVSSLSSVNVVFRFNYPNSTVLATSLINGTLQSIMPNSFKPVSILGVSRMGYNYTYIDKEIENGGFSGYDGMANDSLSLPDSQTVYGRGICSIVTWGLRFELDYEKFDCKNESCSFVSVGDEMFPRFMSIKVVDCLENGKVRYIMQFSNSTYGKGLPFYPHSSLVAEGVWEGKKKRLALVACQVFDKMPHRDCSIRFGFSLSSTLSLRHRSTIVGKMWSTKGKRFGNVTLRSPANVNSRIKGALYKYSEHENVIKFCTKNLDSKDKKGTWTYPGEKSPNLRFDMMVKNTKGQIAYGYASPLYVGDKFYSPFSRSLSQVNNISGNGYMNVSYVMSFTKRNKFDFPASKMVEISAEGVYNTKTGVICMIGCKLMPYLKFQTKRLLDCELLININYAALNRKDAGSVHGTIESTREKSDPLYFDRLEFGSSSITAVQARESIWRMDLEITMVLISNTLACIFIGLQLFHVKKNPEMLPFISVIMLTVLTLAHMIPLLLNFEAIFLVNRKQNVFLGTDQWLEVNEVLVRVITMVAFLLQFRLLQLTWSSRTPDSQKSLWVSDKKVLYLSFPLYIGGGLIAWFTRSLQQPKTKHDLPFWGELKSYAGLVLDSFLFPQILFNLFCETREPVLAPSFYIGSTVVRLLPHAYDLYRTHSSSWFYNKIYANPGMDYYSTGWDIAICFCGVICVIVIYVQQRFGGRFVLPKRFWEYEKVPVSTNER